MNFFKKLFSSKQEKNEPNPGEAGAPLSSIYTTNYFAERYTEEPINPEILDGCIKMVESYFMDNKIERKVQSPINHPTNLDQVEEDGFGFVMYCRAFQLEEEQATLFLAYCFSDFLIKKYGFVLYKDSKPEYPLRGMTVKYDKNGVVLSLYPYEYASKVLNGERTFSELEEKLNAQIATMPDKDELLGKYMNPDNANG